MVRDHVPSLRARVWFLVRSSIEISRTAHLSPGFRRKVSDPLLEPIALSAHSDHLRTIGGVVVERQVAGSLACVGLKVTLIVHARCAARWRRMYSFAAKSPLTGIPVNLTVAPPWLVTFSILAGLVVPTL